MSGPGSYGKSRLSYVGRNFILITYRFIPYFTTNFIDENRPNAAKI